MRVPRLTAIGRMSRHALTAEVARQLVARCGWAPGAAIVVGCSGGVDSTVLLAACAAICHRRSARGQVHAVHVHHHLRPDADLDAAHVERFAQELGVPLLRRDVHPVRGPDGLAADARARRHAALAECAAAVGATHIALAHHADDRLETLIAHLGRGSGLRGLSSIPWTRSAGRGTGVRVARPMLALTRASIEQCAHDVGIPWRDDPGNLDPAAVRGMLRMSVMPALRARWPRIAEHASVAADAARAGSRASRAWSRQRIAGREPTRGLLRAAGPDLSALIVDAWLRGMGVRASWSEVLRIARAGSGPSAAPRTLPAGSGKVIVRAQRTHYEP
jgi:tRNA(Ile)-lysidine synthetase-like protein